MLPTRHAYTAILKALNDCEEDERVAHMRYLARTDLWFLLRYVLNRPDLESTEKKGDWLFARCVEVQSEPDGYLDLWSREHFKSTLITFAKTIQDILASHGEDPLPQWKDTTLTVGIFSHTRPNAKKFLKQIKEEFETNQLLQHLFPDILYENPSKEASKWTEEAICVKRSTNPKEQTVEAWGLVDGMPTGAHFVLQVYDDVVTENNVTTPEMIHKTTTALELSYNLGVTEGGIRRFIGTRYHFNDSYRVVMARRTAIPRIYPATDDGSLTGEAVMWTQEQYEQKVRDFGPYTAATQLLQNPRADKSQGFQRAWLRFYDPDRFSAANLNGYLLCDPANAKKKGSDYTSMHLVGYGADGNFMLIDTLYDRLNLQERIDALLEMHLYWATRGLQILNCGYERYGKDSDIQAIEAEMARRNYRFQVTEVGGRLDKTDRIKRLVPDLAMGRWYLPHHRMRKLWDGKVVDIIEKCLIEEYDAWPVPVHDDWLDGLSRIYDLELSKPLIETKPKSDRYNRRNGPNWMSA
jgi:phage terminase large subunit-like protein